MPLTCSCPYDDDYDWYYFTPDDYTSPPPGRRKRCSSCGALIDHHEQVAKFDITRPPRTEIEERICGSWDDTEAVKMAPKWLCERCSDLYFSLYELGFECISPDENMVELVKEYAETWGAA